MRSDYSGEEEYKEEEERANMLVAGNPATVYVQTAITAFSLQENTPPVKTLGKYRGRCTK